MGAFVRAYRYINLLSLDIVAGAVVSALFFARVLQVTIKPAGLVALGVTVWVIYTADHLRDARSIGQGAATLRHRFHHQHFKVLFAAALAGVAINVIMIFFLRKQVFEWGAVLAVGVSIYLIVQRYLKFLKEICIACLYTCGVMLPSLTVSNVSLTTAHHLLIAQFVMVAWLNLLIFSWFDREDDKQDKQPSFVTMLGEPVTRTTLWCLIAGFFLITAFSLGGNELRPAALIVAAMGFVLALIFIFRKKFAENDLYRLLGDAVFILPLFYLLWTNR